MHRIAVLGLLVCAGLPSHVLAKDTRPAVDRVYLASGRYRADHDLHTRWDASDGSLGTNVNFQRDLGFVDQQDALAWRIGGSFG